MNSIWVYDVVYTDIVVCICFRFVCILVEVSSRNKLFKGMAIGNDCINHDLQTHVCLVDVNRGCCS
jgi:hypothetical protein